MGNEQIAASEASDLEGGWYVLYSCRLVDGSLCIVMHVLHAGAQEALPNSGAHPSHQNTLEKLFANMKVCRDNTDALRNQCEHPAYITGCTQRTAIVSMLTGQSAHICKARNFS